jgi:hypothetical protein
VEERSSPRSYVEVIASTRRTAVGSLVDSLTTAGIPDILLNEVEIRNLWRQSLQRCPEILPEGWYMPPPHGMFVLVANPADGFARNNLPSLRPEPAWPSLTRRMSRDNMLTVYAFPVDRSTGLIGDVEATLYWGKDCSLRRHIRDVWDVIQRIAGEVAVDMPLGDLYRIAKSLFAERGMKNTVLGVNDPTGTNIGHSIPFSSQIPS